MHRVKKSGLRRDSGVVQVKKRWVVEQSVGVWTSHLQYGGQREERRVE